MEFSFDEVGDCNFTINKFHQRFFPVNFDTSFHEISPVFIPIHPVISVVPTCFCEIVFAKNVGCFLEKRRWWSPVLIKLQDNISKTGL